MQQYSILLYLFNSILNHSISFSFSFNLILVHSIQFLQSFYSILIHLIQLLDPFNLIFVLIRFQYCFNLISVFIQFNVYIHSIQLLYSFNSIAIFIQFNCYIYSIQFVIHSIQFSYSFNSICLYSFNQRTHLFNLGVWVKWKICAGSWDWKLTACEHQFEVESPSLFDLQPGKNCARPVCVLSYNSDRHYRTSKQLLVPETCFRLRHSPFQT